MNPSSAPQPSSEKPDVPPVPPQIAKMEQERKEALTIVLEKIKIKRSEMGAAISLNAYGKQYPVREGSEADKTVAEAQMLHEAAKNIYEEVKGHDYRQEQAAIKMVELLNENELLTARYAEMLEHFPDLALQIKKMVPSLSSTETKNDDSKYLVH